MNHTVIVRTGRRLAVVGCAAAVAFGVIAITPDVSADEPKLTIKPKPEALEGVSPELTKPGVRLEQQPGVRGEHKPGMQPDTGPGAALKGVLLKCDLSKPPPELKLRPRVTNNTQKTFTYGEIVVWTADNGEGGEIKVNKMLFPGQSVYGPIQPWFKKAFTKCSAWLK
jgi:hypothetical protein